MSDSKRPPRNSSPTTAATGGQKSTSSGRNSSNTSSGKNASNTPSGSAANEHGQSQLDKQRCSVLCHPLGLPLVSAFFGEDPRKLPHLGQESKYFSSKGTDNDSYNNVLKTAFDEWPTDQTGRKLEPSLTTTLTRLIRDKVCKNEISLQVKSERKVGDASKPQGRVDITLCNVSDDEPMMFLEVGLESANWWKKFDQAVKYVKLKYSEEDGTFTGPLLLAVMTIDDEKQNKQGNENVVVQLAVFLCTKKKKKKDEEKKNFRISLLWHSKTSTLEDGSNAFGRLLRRVCDFTSWLVKLDDAQIESDYEYFSSNCCRVGNNVLRSYDSRVRETTRSPEVYLNKKFNKIVGGEVNVILDVTVSFLDSSMDNSDADLWKAGKSLQVIMTPYRPGIHVAKKAKWFIPIIDDLHELHENEFVHGDIRGFNTVFDGNGGGCMIDFDFGGQLGREYPVGYRNILADGNRLCDVEARIIPKWHDWYALGRLIFSVHTIEPPDDAPDKDWTKLKKLEKEWEKRGVDPTRDMIDELKTFLTKIDQAGWTVGPSVAYAHELAMIFGRKNAGMQGTNSGATGSPPKQKH